MNSDGSAGNPLAEDLEHVLTHTSGIWQALRDQNIFVTGGTGFFGRWLLESFAYANDSLRLNARMVVLSRDPQRFAAQAPHLTGHAAIDVVEGDVREFTAASVRSQLVNAPETYGYVIHAATEASAKLNAEEPLKMIDTIVQGTRAALEFACASGARRFLLTSSGAVYGRQPSEMTHLAETYSGAPDCSDPGSAYGEGKRLAELLCVCFHKQFGIEPVLARCFAFVGPFLPLDAHFAIGNFIRDTIAGAPIRISGDGTPYRSYLYAADLAIWLWTLLVNAAPSRPYNVGSEDDRTIKDMAEQVAAVAGPAAVQIGRAPDPAKRPERYVPSCGRAREEAGLGERIDLAEAIRRTVSFARLNARPQTHLTVNR